MTDQSRPVCLVTGAGRRLGAVIAEHLASTFDVALHYNMSAEEAALVADACRARGARAEIFRADLDDPSQSAQLVADAHVSLGPIDLVVSSASLFENDLPSAFDPERMQHLLRVNLVSPMVIAREFARHATPAGTFIQILDNKVFAPNPDFFSYSLGKFALKGALDMLAMHFAPQMRVCAIAPGLTLRSGDQTEAEFREDWTKTLTGEGATPSDIADAVSFIWNTKSFNADTIVLDGGQRLMRLPRDVAFMRE